MKKTFTKILVAVMILTVAGAYSCKNRGESKKLKEIESSWSLQALEQKIEENVYPLPTSAEVLKKLTDMDLGYIIGATNPLQMLGIMLRVITGQSIWVFLVPISVMPLFTTCSRMSIDYLAAMRTLAL
ncbi:MAG: hypothetical protein MZV63_51735 [Marinilabiliales bacterium]|nr:hypothetical protein [Marinilabiliales bacterium]